MKESNAMKNKGYKFFICKNCNKQYPAKTENPKGFCLFCLQDKNSWMIKEEIIKITR